MNANAFTDSQTAQNYLEFLKSPSGKYQQEILFQTIKSRLPIAPAKVLDAACGSGWLTKLLTDAGYAVVGCDNSGTLLDAAKKNYPTLAFNYTDITTALPYGDTEFDAIVVNMAAQDVASISSLYVWLYKVLRPNGKLLITLPNPAYAYPIGVWKRGFWGKLFGKKPRLILNQYAEKPDLSKPVSTYLRPLSDYINEAKKQNFQLTYMEELKSETDSNDFGLQYQMYRYPLIILLELTKS